MWEDGEVLLAYSCKWSDENESRPLCFAHHTIASLWGRQPRRQARTLHSCQASSSFWYSPPWPCLSPRHFSGYVSYYFFSQDYEIFPLPPPRETLIIYWLLVYVFLIVLIKKLKLVYYRGYGGSKGKEICKNDKATPGIKWKVAAWTRE